MEKEFKKNKKDSLFALFITETVFIAVILCSILIMKYFFKTPYAEIKKWYTNNFLTETSISEVIEESGKNEV